jgi:hypothetical protein
VTVKKEVAEKITALLLSERRKWRLAIDANRSKINELARENTILKRELVVITQLCNEWQKKGAPHE